MEGGTRWRRGMVTEGRFKKPVTLCLGVTKWMDTLDQRMISTCSVLSWWGWPMVAVALFRTLVQLVFFSGTGLLL